MSSRSKILSKIKTLKIESVDIPAIDIDGFTEQYELLPKFIEMVEASGGAVFKAASNQEILQRVKELFPESVNNYSSLSDSSMFNTIDMLEKQKPHDFEKLDVLVLQGDFGVAENGAIWISDHGLPVRVLPFISKHLVLVLDKSELVADLHQAYARLEESMYGFGLFISGPSKTADIEQSLVMGAQGALSLSVFLR